MLALSRLYWIVFCFLPDAHRLGSPKASQYEFVQSKGQHTKPYLIESFTFAASLAASVMLTTGMALSCHFQLSVVVSTGIISIQSVGHGATHKSAACTFVFDDRVNGFCPTNNRINRTSLNTLSTTDTHIFVNEGNGRYFAV